MAILEEELKRFQERLKECLAKRGEAYTLGGDGWHDNAAFEALEAEYHYLTSRIDDIKSELFKLHSKKEPLSPTGLGTLVLKCRCDEKEEVLHHHCD